MLSKAGKLVGARHRIGMLGTEDLLADPSARSTSGRAPARSALGLKHEGEVVEICCYFGMLGADHLFVDRQRTLDEQSSPRKVALVMKQAGSVVEVPRRIVMLGTVGTPVPAANL